MTSSTTVLYSEAILAVVVVLQAVYYLRFGEVDLATMDDWKATEIVKRFLDENDYDYEFVKSDHNTLCITCPRNSEAPKVAFAARKRVEPDWSGIVIREGLKGKRDFLSFSLDLPIDDITY